MNWRAKRLTLVLAMVAAGCLAAGCSSAIKNAVASASPGESFTVSPPTRSPRTFQPPTPSPQNQTTEASPAPAAPAASAAEPSQSSGPGDSATLWLLVVLGAVALAVVVYLAARHGSRRSATTASWRSGVADASAKGWALSDAVAMAQAPAESAPGTASVRWADIQRRADDLAQTLYALRERAPGDLEAGRADDVLAALHGLRSAMNTEPGPGDPGSPDHARIRSRLAAFEAALNTLHQPDPYKI